VLRSRLSNHGLGVAEAIRLSEALDRLPPRLRVYGIEAAGFEPGVGVTPEVLAAVRRVAGEIAAHVDPRAVTH
jgi:hydrogenase maturation protease